MAKHSQHGKYGITNRASTTFLGMPLLLPLIGLIAGILLGNQFQLPIWGIAPISVACVVYLYILKKSDKPTAAIRLNKYHKTWILFLFCGIGIIDMGFHKPDSFSKKELEKYTIAEGEIKETKALTSGDRFIVSIKSVVDSLGHVRQCDHFTIMLTTSGLSASVGDIITFPARFIPITDNPNLRPSGFADRMKRNGIFYRVSVGENEVSLSGFNNTLSNRAMLWRDEIVTKLEKSHLSRQTCDFISALLLGDRSFITDEVRNSFSNAGVAHILALSGLHVTILMGIVLSLLFPLKILGLHTVRYIIAIIILWIFVFLTGMAPSTIRASIMTTFVILALLLQRRNSPENALLAAVFLILIINPRSIFDIGLQLSVLSVGSILLFGGPLNPVNRKAHPFLHSLTAAVLVSLIATAATWVVIAFYFKSIPLLFLPANLCLLPILPLYIWIAITYLGLLHCGLDIKIFAVALNEGYDCFDWLVTRLSCYGQSAISLNIQLPILIIWLIGILILAYTLKKKNPKKKILLSGGLGFLALSIALIPLFNKKAPASIIFQKNFSDISLALYDGDMLKVALMPRNTISRISHKGGEIISIDTHIDIDSLTTILNQSRRKRRKNYLILGGGFKGISLKDLPYLKKFDKIILHSSLKRKMEKKLRQEADDLGIYTLHSLREDGSLEEVLPDSLPDNI